MYGTAVKYI